MTSRRKKTEISTNNNLKKLEFNRNPLEKCMRSHASRDYPEISSEAPKVLSQFPTNCLCEIALVHIKKQAWKTTSSLRPTINALSSIELEN